MKASSKRKRNGIEELKNDEGEGLSGTRLDNHIVDYFKSMFLASKERGPMEFLSNLENKVSEQMIGELPWNYTAYEAKLALKKI